MAKDIEDLETMGPRNEGQGQHSVTGASTSPGIGGATIFAVLP